MKDVPYLRLMDNCVSLLPAKLDSDSKLHTEKTKLAVSVPDGESLPKNSISDSKLAVDYFNAPTNVEAEQVQSSVSLHLNVHLQYLMTLNDFLA